MFLAIALHHLFQSNQLKFLQIDLASAIEAYTINGAFVNFLDDRVGSIERGKQADLVIINKNLFDIPPEEINEAEVTATLFNGKLVYGSF